jgi:hypothetical protein
VFQARAITGSASGFDGGRYGRPRPANWEHPSITDTRCECLTARYQRDNKRLALCVQIVSVRGKLPAYGKYGTFDHTPDKIEGLAPPTNSRSAFISATGQGGLEPPPTQSASNGSCCRHIHCLGPFQSGCQALIRPPSPRWRVRRRFCRELVRDGFCLSRQATVSYERADPASGASPSSASAPSRSV